MIQNNYGNSRTTRGKILHKFDPFANGIVEEPCSGDLRGLVAPVVEEVVDFACGGVFKVGDEARAVVDGDVAVDVRVLVGVWMFV